VNDTQSISRILIRVCALTLLVGGCAGSGDGLDQNGLPLGNGNSGTAPSEFDVIQNTIFTPLCTGCHSGANAPLGLSLAAGQSYAQLVGVPTIEVASLLRVQPGDADNSYLIQKLIGTAAVGDRMPAGGPYLTPAAVDLVRQWIGSGALPPANAVSMAPLDMNGAGMKVNVAAPTSTRIVIGFDRDVDLTLVNSSTVTLRRFGDEQSLPIHMSAARFNPSVLLIAPNAPLPAGHYELTLRGSGGGALAGLDARPLNAPAGHDDGEDFTLHFSVEIAQ
jgi:hypothetical protein